MVLSTTAVAFGSALYVFYYLGNYFLQFAFYYLSRPRDGGRPRTGCWKTRPDLTAPLRNDANVPFSPLLRCCRRHAWREEHPWAWLFTTLNPAMSAVGFAMLVEAVLQGRTRMYFDCPVVLGHPTPTPAASASTSNESVTTMATGLDVRGGTHGGSVGVWAVTYVLSLLPGSAVHIDSAGFAGECAMVPSVLAVAVELVALYLYENVLEYYWHRLMHVPFFYRHMHKVHHYNKSPIPFDDMLIHPLEAAGYYTLLFSPPFVLCHNVWAFVGYMAIMGVCGILDHSGVRVHVPGLYASHDHDAHHRWTKVNYGFPHPLLDLVHGTFHGSFTCCGRTREYRLVAAVDEDKDKTT